MNAFMVFAKFNRQQTANVMPGAGNGEVSKALGVTWRSLSDEQQRPFYDEANRLYSEHHKMYPGTFEFNIPRLGQKAKE